MTDHGSETRSHPFTPVTSDADWEEKGWAAESEPLAAAPALGATITIRLDHENAALVRRAARLLGTTKTDLVREAAITAATEAIQRADERGDSHAIA